MFGRRPAGCPQQGRLSNVLLCNPDPAENCITVVIHSLFMSFSLLFRSKTLVDTPRHVCRGVFCEQKTIFVTPFTRLARVRFHPDVRGRSIRSYSRCRKPSSRMLRAALWSRRMVTPQFGQVMVLTPSGCLPRYAPQQEQIWDDG